MEAILPFKIKNEQMFYESALKVGYNEMEVLKFIYVMQHSDMDIFPKMLDERINVLLYGWELCEDYKKNLNPNEWELPEEMETVLKLLVPWSLDIWFSKEWDRCKYYLKNALIHCLNRARDLLMRMPDMMQINWDFLLLYNMKPWNVLYLKNLTVTKEKTLENGAQSIETEELPATNEDISYVKLEQLPIIVLRLVKLFDQSSIDMVKTLCMRVIAAWNKIHQTELETSGSRRPYVPPEDKKCLLLICHIYLMAVYESDDVKGHVIDNMINNIRFYYQGFQNCTHLHAMDNLEYTPARYIALTNIHLRVQKRDFFDFFIWNKYDTALVNLFGVVSQAYKSYLLGNLLMELNNMNEDDFTCNIPLYKRLMNSYVNEREKSELFLINELEKIEAQRYAHNIIQTVQNVTDFKSKICKGNRMSNIGNYENSDDTVAPLADTKSEQNISEIKYEETKEDVVGEDIEDERDRVRIKENELRMDPIFQNLPNNENMLYYVYDILAKRDYNGWHFAKVVLLIKIISLEQNMIETWRYHPGLTTDFMLNLEVKLSNHYVDLAKIFKNHSFIEQEFWLTAFYLNPTLDLYEVVKRLGMRNNRKRADEHTKLVMSVDNIDAKYGLLSSTIDVKELATMSNTDDPARDYDPLFSALHSLRVPDSLVKDMLTAIFLPRNRSFAWSVDWVLLRNRCKIIMTSSKEKKRFVDLNMAEANERLKYLIIDYEKYKNRPQLDYGTIEEGYENLMSVAEFDKESEDEEDEEEEDFEDDEDVYESKKRGRGRPPVVRKKPEEKVEDDNSQEDDPFLMGKRRTRARTAATLASYLFQTLPRSSRRKRNPKYQDEETKTDEDKISAEIDDKSSDSKSPITTSESAPLVMPTTSDSTEKDTEIANISKKNLNECLKERPAFLNTTQGFKNLIDIWNVKPSDLQIIDENCVSLLESSSALQIALKLKLLNKEINPLGCDENEFINDKEMLIHNAEYIIKKETKEEISDVIEIEDKKVLEKPVAMEIDNNEENGKNYIIEVVATAEKNKETYIKLSEENLIENETELQRDETGFNQKAPQLEENSNESINTDESTTARKDSGEFSETNTAINSKRNSINIEPANTDDLNIDIDMSDKTMQNEVACKQTETSNEIKESSMTELELTNETVQETTKIYPETENTEKEITQDVKNKTEEKNKVRDESKADEKQEQKDQLKSVKENEAHETNESDKEIKTEEENATLLTNKTEKETTSEHEKTEEESKREGNHVKDVNKMEEENKVERKNEEDDEIQTIEGEENIMDAKTSSKERNETEEKSEAQKESNSEKNNKLEEENALQERSNEGMENNTMEESETDEKHKAGMQSNAKEETVIEQVETNEISSIDVHNKITQDSNNENEPLQLENNEVSKSKNVTAKPTLNEELVSLHDNMISKDKEHSTSTGKESHIENNFGELFLSLNQLIKEHFKEACNSNEIKANECESLQEQTNKSDTKSKDYLNNEENESQRGIESQTTDDKDSLSQLRNNELNSTNEEINKTSELETDSISYPKSTEKTDCQQIETIKYEDDKRTDQEKAKTTECQTVTEESNNEVKLKTTDCKNLIDTSSDQTKTVAIESNADTTNNEDKDTSKENESANPLSTCNASTIANQEHVETTNCQTLEDSSSGKTNLEATDYPDASSHPVEIASIFEIVLDKLNINAAKELGRASSDEGHIEITQKETALHSPIIFSDNTTQYSVKTPEIQIDTDVETQHLKHLCLTTNSKIVLEKLKPADLINLRQPKIKIQRINYEKYLAEPRSKRRRTEGRVYWEFDESSNSINSFGTNTSSSDTYHPTKLKRKAPIRRRFIRQAKTSESDYDSNNSDDLKLSTIISKSRKRRLSTASTSQNSTYRHVTGPKSARKSGPKSARKTGPKSSQRTAGPKSFQQNLVVTPRSASGLKLRISNAEQQNRQERAAATSRSRDIIIDEVIQLSSSSDEYVLNDLQTIAEEVIEIEEYALFEEEIII